MAEKVRDRGKLRKKRTKLYREVRNTSFFGTIISYILLMVLFAVMFIVVSGFFAEYILESKFSEEYSKLKVVADFYDSGKDNPDIEKLLNSSKNDFLILDDSGNVIYLKGKNTCSSNGSEIKMSNNTETYYVYSDSEVGLICPDGKGGLDIKWKEIWNWYRSNVKSSTDPHNKEMGSFNAPLWVSIDLKNGGNLVGKMPFSYSMKDFALIGEVALSLTIISIVIGFLLVANLISGIVKIMKVMKLYYLDTITNGYNWAYYLRNGDRRIRRLKKENWAAVNFVFRNYRNYCLCHSVAEGEEVLADINKKITGMLKKGEICTHAASSAFALLLKYEDEMQLRIRLQEIIREIQLMDGKHTFVFQAGAALLPGVGNPDGSGDSSNAVNRKNIFVEDIYNNACAARTVICDSEETSIYFFDSDLLEDQKWNDAVLEHQWSALKNEEFVVYYQPKYNPSTNALSGAEALIRWKSPEFGFVTPGRIIPIFERNGFITEIDHYMISHVARDQKNWLDQGYKCVPVSVNVSRAHFVEKDLAEQIRDMVDREGCPHNLIEIELTESAFFDDKKAMIDTIKKLKSYGFAVSMDDFGAGYSSLNSLKDMPLDVLKLDADFFRGEAEGDRGEIVVSEAIRLAKNLGMRTVAEGVEDEKQVKFLAEQKCDMIQGFFYAKPMPKDDYVSLIDPKSGEMNYG